MLFASMKVDDGYRIDDASAMPIMPLSAIDQRIALHAHELMISTLRERA